jgi:hypothetical protein
MLGHFSTLGVDSYHLTHYRYDRPVSLAPQIIRLRPAPHSRTRVISHTQGQPETAFREPPAGPLRQLDGALRVSRAGDGTEDRGGPGRRHDGLQPVRFLRRGSGGGLAVRLPRRTSAPDLVIYRTPGAGGPRCSSFSSVPRTKPDGGFRRRPQRAAANEIGYVIRMEPGVQTPEETWSRQGIVPRFSWLLVQALGIWACRALRVGLPDPAEAGLVALDGPSGTDHDFTDLHAWARSTCPAPAGSALIRPRVC